MDNSDDKSGDVRPPHPDSVNSPQREPGPRWPTQVEAFAAEIVPEPTDTALASVWRTKIRAWGQQHKIVLNALIILVPLFFTFGAVILPGLVRLGFVICGWLIIILAGYLAWDIVRWPQGFTTAWKTVSAAVLACFLGWGTWRLYEPQQPAPSLTSSNPVMPSPIPTTDFSGIPQTRLQDAASMLRDDLRQLQRDTGVTHLRLSDALSAQVSSPIYATNWTRALHELERQGAVKNVKAIKDLYWTYHGLDGREETFDTNFWFDIANVSEPSPPTATMFATPRVAATSSSFSAKHTSQPTVVPIAGSKMARPGPRTTPVTGPVLTQRPFAVPPIEATAPSTVAPSVVASATWIPKNASAVAVSTGGCELSTPTLGSVPLTDLKQQVTLDDATAALKSMLLEQIRETKSNHIDSLALVFESQGQAFGPKNAADWVAAVSELKRAGILTKVAAWPTVMIYANIGIWERCYTDYSFDVRMP